MPISRTIAGISKLNRDIHYGRGAIGGHTENITHARVSYYTVKINPAATGSQLGLDAYGQRRR